jgi:YD repeat-containing protein
MVAIVSGNSLGLLEGSAAGLGQRGVIGSATQGNTGEGAYLNIATGNLVLQGRDDYLASRGLDVALTRTYNAQGKLSDDNGDNWGMGLVKRVANLTGTLNTAGSSLTRIEGDGSETVYTYDGARGVYRSTQGAGAHDTLSYNSKTKQWLWTDGDTRATETYDWTKNGRLIASTDLNKNTLTYKYNTAGLLSQITDASGENTYFDYAGTRLTQIRVAAGTGGNPAPVSRVRYEYDASNRLAAVITDLTPDDNSIADGNTYVTRYTYDGASTRVASVAQSDGTRLAFTYEQAGAIWRVKQVVDGEGRITRLDYAPGGSTTVTDAQGYQTVYAYDAQGQLTGITGPLIGGAAIAGVTRHAGYAYDAQGNVTQIADALGNVVDLEYDANGNQTLQRDAAGNTVRRTYGGQNQLLTETVYLIPDPDGSGAAQPGQAQTTRYVYDSRNQLRFSLSAEGRVIEYRYNGRGDRIAAIQYNASAYDVGTLAEAAAPGEAQLLLWVAGADKAHTSRTDYNYDLRGLLSRSITYAKVDAMGNGIADGAQSLVRYVYDQAGQLLQSIDANNGITSFTYDGLGRRLSSTDALNRVTLTSHDDAHNSVVTTLANGLSTTSAYDKAGELIGVTQTDPNAVLLGQTRYSYDANGHLRMTENPTGQRTYRLYDAAGRKVADIDADGSLVEYVYDGNDQLTQTIRYANTIDTALLTGADGKPADIALAALRVATPGADRTSWNSYDAAGRLVKSVDVQGFVTQIDYDGASRAVRTVRYANAISTAALGSAPAPEAINPAGSAADRITRSFYDHDGKLLGELDAEGYLSTYRYDIGGRLVETVAYANATDSALRTDGSLAQLMPAAGTNDIRQYQLHDSKGQLAGSIDGEGYLTEFVYDRNGNLGRKVRYATPVTYLEGTTVADLRPLTAAEDHIATYAYTKLNQLRRETAADGTVSQYLYDEVGNLVSTTHALGTTEARTSQMRFDRQGRLIAELSAEGAAQLVATMTQADIDAVWNLYAVKYQYDAAGRRIGMTDQNGHRTLYFYDRDGRLAASVNALGEVETRTYSAHNELTGTRRFGTRLAADTLAGLAGGQIEDGFAAILAVLSSNAVDSAREFRYDSRGLLVAQYDELGARTSADYDAFGNVIARSQQIDAGHFLQQAYGYDRRGLQTQAISDPAGINARTATRYDAFGRAIDSTDANGNTRTRSYDRLGRIVLVRDAQGAALRTTYDAFDRVLTQTDSLDHITRYAYNTQQRSMMVSTAEGITQTVLSNRYGQQYRITDGNGNATTFAYDKNGDLLSITDALSKLVTHTYDRAGNLASTRDANGRTTNFSYDAVNRVLSKTSDPAGLNLVTAYSYDAKGQVLTVTDPNGIVTGTEYDAKGQVRRITVDPAGLNQVTQLSYDGRGKTLQVTDANGHVTQYKYDTLGRRTQQIVDPDGLRLVTRFAYDANGNVLARTDANGQVTRFVYDTNDRATHEVDAAGGVTEYRYDANGRVIQTVKYANPISLAGLNAAIGATDIASRLTPDAGRDNSVKNIYDRDGRLVFMIGGKGAVSRRSYDGNGNVIRTIAYAHAIASGTPATVDAVQAAVDAIANAEQDALSINAYDVRNRMTAQVDGTGAVTTLAYDANGNVLYKRSYANRIDPGVLPANPSAADIKAQVAADDAHDQQVRMLYDAANRLTSSATAQGVDGSGVLQWAVVRQRYDQNGNVVSRTAQAHFLSSASFPASATQINIQSWIDSVAPDSAQDRTTRLAYDAANRLVYSIDALDTVTQRIYDAVGNVIKTVTYATPLPLGGTPDAQAIGNALTASAQDHVGRTVYDAANRAVYDIDALGHVTERQYDAAGNVISVLRRATPITLASLAAAPSMAQIQALLTADAGDRLERQVFDADHRLRYRIDAEGFVKQTDYDALGRVTRTTQYANRVALGAANVTEQALAAALQASPEQDRVNTFAYDAQGNLVRSSDALGAQESYTYDALGRKLSLTNKKGATWDYRYDAAGRLISELAPQVEAAGLVAYVDGEGKTRYHAQTAWVRAQTRLGYDAFGNLTARTEAAGTAQERTTRYEYDAQGRQIRTVFPRVAVYDAPADGLSTAGDAARVEMPNVELSSYVAYDALGDAVMNTDVAGNRSYKTYDRAGRVAFEIDAKGFATGYTRDAFGNATALTRYADPIEIAGTTDTPLTQHHLQIAQFYTGLLNRAPDMAGFVNAVAALDAGVPISDLAQGFIDSPEARNNPQLFPSSLNNQQFLSRLYQLVLGREVDPEGAAYWGAQLDSGVSRGRVAADIIYSIASYSGTAPGELAEQARFNNKVATGLSQASIAQLKAAGIETLLAGGDHAADRVIRTHYDALGRTVKVVEPQVYAFDQHSTLGSQQFEPQAYAFDQHSTLGSQQFTAGKATETGYNAFGDAIRQSVYGEDAQGARTTEASEIHFYFNARGERTAQIALADGASHLGYLSEMEYDAAGNLTRQVEYANGLSSWSDTTYGIMPQADLSDRETRFTYDRANRKIAETRINVEFSGGADGSPRGNVVTTFAYDAVGNLTRTSDALGGTTYTYHDAVGRVTAVVAGSTAATGTAMPLTEFKLDIYGNVVHRTDYALGAIFADEATYVANQQNSDDRITSTVYDSHGHAVQTVDAEGNAAFMSYDKSGRVAKQWQTVTNNDGLKEPALKETAFKQMRYDALGQLVEMVEPDSGSAVVRRGIDYNAFGEVVGKSTNGSTYEYADYDNAGRVWRTNTGDGVDKVMLHDIAGHTTADIRSATLNLKAGYTSAAQIVNLSGLLRTDTRYNLMGRVVEKTSPAHVSSDTASSMQTAFMSAAVTSSATYGVVGWVGDGNGFYDWSGTNTVQLNWSSLAGLGSGDVKVQLDYGSNPVMVSYPDEGGTANGQLAPAQEASYTRIFSADQAENGVTMSWSKDADGNQAAPGVDHIGRIRLWEKDVNGQWALLIDSHGQGAVTQKDSEKLRTVGSFVHINAPADPNIVVTLQYRLIGSNAFQPATLLNFGDTLIFNPDGLAEGNYEYQVMYQGVVDAHDQGTLAVASLQKRLQVAQLYVALFNRGPELAGLNNWVAALNSGMTIENAAKSMLSSVEATALNQTGNVDFVKHLYRTIMGRDADPAGLDYWTGELNHNIARSRVVTEMIGTVATYAGTAADKLAEHMLFDNKVAVALIYAGELGGNDAYVARDILTQVSATDMGAGIAAANDAVITAQLRTQVTQLYIALFNRAPDRSGLDNWVVAMRGGWSGTAVAQSMLGSAEANTLKLPAMGSADFVTHLYRTVLGRETDPSGLTSWSGKLDQLAASQGVLAAKAQIAAEIVNAIASYAGSEPSTQASRSLLGNKVAIGLAYAIGLGANDPAVATAIIANVSAAPSAAAAAAAASALALSQATAAADTAAIEKEAAAELAINAAATPLEQLRTQVAQLYVALLGRAPEPAGLQLWVTQLRNGATPGDVADGILNHPEARTLYPSGMDDIAFVYQVYHTVLNRLPDPAGLITWPAALKTQSRGTVAYAIIQGFLQPSADNPDQLVLHNLFSNKVAAALTYALSQTGNDPATEAAIIAQSSATGNAVAAALIAAAATKVATDAAILAAGDTASAAMSADAAAAAAAAAATFAGNFKITAALTDARTQITQLYAALFDRAPDLGGLNGWVAVANSGVTMGDIAQAFLAHDEAKPLVGMSNAEFVTQLYYSVLNRAPDPEGLGSWSGKLVDQPGVPAMTRGQLALALIGSIAGTHATDAATLGSQAWFDKRVADGLAAMSAAAAAVANSATASKKIALDNAALAVAHYQDTAAAAVAALTAAGFVTLTPGARIRTQVAQLYVAVLGRAPDLTGINFWSGLISNGLSMTDAAKGMLSSSEAQAVIPAGMSNAQFITQLYHTVQNREPEPGAIDFWLNQIDITSRAQVVVAIINSDEAQAPQSAFNIKLSTALASAAAQTGAAAAAAITAANTAGTTAANADATAIAYGNAASTANSNLYWAQVYANQTAATAAATPYPASIGQANLREICNMYAGLVNRTPEMNGVWFWNNLIQSGWSPIDIANGILVSPETQSWYPASMSNEQFITQLYHVVQNREPEPGAIEFWTNLLGTHSRGEIAYDIIYSPEAQGGQFGSRVNGAVNTINSSLNAAADAYYTAQTNAQNAANAAITAANLATDANAKAITAQNAAAVADAALIAANIAKAQAAAAAADTGIASTDAAAAASAAGIAAAAAQAQAVAAHAAADDAKALAEKATAAAAAASDTAAALAKAADDNAAVATAAAAMAAAAAAVEHTSAVANAGAPVGAALARTQITQLYVALLNRAPDLDGLNHQVAAIAEHGVTLEDVANNMLGSAEEQALFPDPSDSAFLTHLYRSVLNRDPDAVGMPFWTARLHGNPAQNQAPVSRGQVALEIIHSIAYSSASDVSTLGSKAWFDQKVAAALDTVSLEALARAADPAAATAQVVNRAMAAADTDAAAFDAAAAAAVTPSMQHYRQVVQLYALLLNRAPDLGGLAAWVGGMNAGLSLAAVAQGIVDKPEWQALNQGAPGNAAILARIARNALGRELSAGELAAWTGRLNAAPGAEGPVYADLLAAVLGAQGTNFAGLVSKQLFNNQVALNLNLLAWSSADAAATDAAKAALAKATAVAAQAIAGMHLIEPPHLQQAALHGSVVTGQQTRATPLVRQTADRWGNVLSLTDARNPNWKTTYTYNANNQVTQETKPNADGSTTAASPTSRFYYDQLGRTVATRDARGYMNSLQYDSNGNLAKERQADGGTVEYAYDLFGDRTRVKQANGTLTSYAYDHLGRQTSVTRGEVDVYEVVYLDRDNVYTDPQTPTEYPTDVLDGVTVQQRRTTRALVDTFGYDELGRRISSTNAAGESTFTAYDLRGNVVSTGAFGKETRSTYDAYNHKIGETDANGAATTWDVDAFGKIARKATYHEKLGGVTVSYEYNQLNQLAHQTSTRGQDLTYSYDEAGLLTRIDDAALGQVTEYRYDLAGNRLREKTAQQGRVVQDNHLGYDTQGRLVSVDDGRYSLRYTYDANGNRTHVRTLYRNGSDEARDIQSWSAYDEMNRQTVVDGVLDADGNAGISAKQGHRITYDHSGNRTSDTYYGKKIVKTPPPPWSGMTPYLQTALTTFEVPDGEGEIHETYAYDAANRLTDVYRDDFDLQGDGKSLRIEARRYDAAGRVVYGGMVGYVPGTDADIGFNERLSAKLREIGLNPETSTSIYENGLLVRQNHRDFNRSHTSDIQYTYGAAGNLDRYDLTVHGRYGHVERYVYSYDLREGYSLNRIDATNLNKGTKGAVLNSFDANGNLVKVDDTTKAENDRSLVNDVAGHVLLKAQGEEQVHTLIVNGEVLGTSGNSGTPDTFSVTHVPVTAPSLSAPPSAYTVHGGDTLQGIAKAVWGDGSLWYLIAEANGLSGNVTVGAEGGAAAELVDGQTVTIPSRSNTVHNDFRTFKPYDPSSVVGDTTPNLPVPSNDGGCGGMGQILVAAIAIVVAAYTGIYVGGGLQGAVIGAAAGSVVSQGVAIAIGVQDKFSWEQVAFAALSAGITQGVTLPGVDNVIVDQAIRGAFNNVVNQGLRIAVGLQDKFSWAAVAASAIAAPIANEIGDAVGGALGGTIGQIAGGFARGVTNQVLVTGMTGGKIQAANIAADAFGNAIGNSIVEGMRPSYGDVEMAQDFARETNRFSEATSMSAEASVSGLSGSYWDTHPMIYASNDVTDSFSPKVMSDVSGRFVEASGPYGQGWTDEEGTKWLPGPGAEERRMTQEEKLLFQMEGITEQQGQPTIYNLDTGTVGWSVPTSDIEMRPLPEATVNNTPTLIAATGSMTIGLGNLSMKYETRMAPSEYRKAAGVVSSGKGDLGGISYGAYQLASNVGKVQDFLKNNGAPWASRFAGMDPTIVGDFGKTWKAIAALPSDDFFNAQHAYIKESNFDPVVQYLQKKTGLDIMTQPLAVQDAVWSASVQHGGARTFLKAAIDSVQVNRTSPEYPEMLLNAIYEKRIAYVNALNKMDTTTKSNLVNIRYPDELSRALQMLNK